MTKEDEGHYSDKHPGGGKVEPEIEKAIRDASKDNEIACASAFKVSGDLGISTGELGVCIDLLEIRLVKCSLGLFGYKPEKRIVKPAENVAPELEEAIREALVYDRLACSDAWDLAKRLGKRKMEISSACEALGIKISACQLGAF
ncbi:hypothetical protein ACFL2O_02700 [Thermodesulfobacteriota bacterium]